MTEPRFDPPTEADPGGCTPGAVFLREMIFARWPKYRGDAGCYLHNGKTDSGNPSFHSVGRAIDIWIATGHLDVGTSIFDWCIANRSAIGLNEVIFNRRIWRADNLSAGVHAYTVNPHTDHIHIAINRDAARRLPPFYQRVGASPGGFLMALSDQQQLELYLWAKDLHAFKDEITKPGNAPWSGALLKVNDLHARMSETRDRVNAALKKILG